MTTDRENAYESSRNAVGAYADYAVIAQQELFQLGMKLVQRQIDIGRKITGLRNFGQAIDAWTEFAKPTVEDFSAATTLLLDQVSAVGSTMAQSTGGKPLENNVEFQFTQHAVRLTE